MCFEYEENVVVIGNEETKQGIWKGISVPKSVDF